MRSEWCVSLFFLFCFLLMTMGQANTELPDVLRGSYKGSFAYKTITERMPVILTKVIDLLHREKVNIGNQYGDAAREKLKQVNGSLSELKSTMQRNKPLVPLTGDAADIPLWNRLLEEQWVAGEPPVWFEAPWLFVECYMYRRIREVIENSGELREYDFFGQQKRDTLEASMAALELLGEHLLQTVSQPSDALSPDQLQRAFSDFIGMSLWANKNDLSISAGAHVSQAESPLAQLVELNHRVLVNDSHKVFAQLRKLKDRSDVRIDIVMDNAGFELFSDLCLADLLTSLNIAQHMTFHIKAIPWFVSDTTPEDVRYTLQHLSATDKPALPRLAERWQHYLDAGTWRFQTDRFWTSPLPYSRMSTEAPELYQQLSAADLLIFKGDLNYRKLLGDRNWPHDTGFCASLEGFHPAPLLALRTLKADLVSGLAPEREALTADDPNWMVSGEWALVQLCECADTPRKTDEL